MDPVLIVGGGPVGLMMAAELRRHGAECRIIEKRSEPSSFCKALGVTPRTLEVWEAIGVAQSAIDAGHWLPGQRVFVDGRRVKEAKLELPGSPFGFLSLPQYETERILAEHLATFGTAVERGIELASFQEDADGVTAELRRADGQAETWRGPYLVGCDGAHSTVRRGLELSFEGDRFPLEFLIADVELDWELPHGWANLIIQTEAGEIRNVLVCIPITNRGRYRVSTVFRIEGEEQGEGVEHGQATDRADPTLADVQELVTRLSPVPAKVSQLRWSGFFRISHRIVSRYQVGRVFLAGDAAHIHPPTGGQGMNTGLQDAHNLAWKMALDLRGLAAAGLLDSYDAERRPIGEALVQSTTKRTMSLHERTKEDDAADLRADSQLDLNYRSSRWVGEGAGERTADVAGLRREGVAQPFRLLDLLRGTAHVLLIYADQLTSAPERSRLEALAIELRRGLGSDLRCYLVTTAGLSQASIPELPAIVDAEGQFRQAYGAAGSAAVLVRPDGYVGWRAKEIDHEGVMKYLWRVFR